MDALDIDVVKLFQATGHEARITALVLVLLETQGYSEVECGESIIGSVGSHIESYREQFRVALGLAEQEVAYAQEAETEG